MFSGGQATKSLILIFAWITSCISFYALSLNSADLKGNIFESFFYARSSAWGTIFVYLTLLTMGNYIQIWNWGRTKSLILSHFVLGCSCIILAYIPKKNEKAVLGVYMIGSIFASVSKYIKYFISFLNHIIYQISPSRHTLNSFYICICHRDFENISNFLF